VAPAVGVTVVAVVAEHRLVRRVGGGVVDVVPVVVGRRRSVVSRLPVVGRRRSVVSRLPVVGRRRSVVAGRVGLVGV
jgi:hypothetical protein